MNWSEEIVRGEVVRHPGDVLRQLMAQAENLTQDDLAKRLGVSRYSVNQLVNRKRSVTAEMALRLAKAFSTSPKFWLNLQLAVDLSDAWGKVSDDVLAIDPVRDAVPESELFEDVE